ncbi:hypothetical protein ACGF0J_13440 [Nonomuraea sp. NPDC047897]|uniref:hypothetical protein n=1 Tax=Nonomuraea sp. NPDC047897 TaxID=3364346 RepID=UPI003720EE8B
MRNVPPGTRTIPRGGSRRAGAAGAPGTGRAPDTVADTVAGAVPGAVPDTVSGRLGPQHALNASLPAR